MIKTFSNWVNCDIIYIWQLFVINLMELEMDDLSFIIHRLPKQFVYSRSFFLIGWLVGWFVICQNIGLH